MFPNLIYLDNWSRQFPYSGAKTRREVSIRSLCMLSSCILTICKCMQKIRKKLSVFPSVYLYAMLKHNILMKSL